MSSERPGSDYAASLPCAAGSRPPGARRLRGLRHYAQATAIRSEEILVCSRRSVGVMGPLRWAVWLLVWGLDVRLVLRSFAFSFEKVAFASLLFVSEYGVMFAKLYLR